MDENHWLIPVLTTCTEKVFFKKGLRRSLTPWCPLLSKYCTTDLPAERGKQGLSHSVEPSNCSVPGKQEPQEHSLARLMPALGKSGEEHAESTQPMLALSFFLGKEGDHSGLSQSSSVFCPMCGRLLEGAVLFLFFFTFPLIPLNSGHMPAWRISSAHWANRKLCVFCFKSSFITGRVACWIPTRG